jgi:hypothetical protein
VFEEHSEPRTQEFVLRGCDHGEFPTGCKRLRSAAALMPFDFGSATSLTGMARRLAISSLVYGFARSRSTCSSIEVRISPPLVNSLPRVRLLSTSTARCRRHQ